MSDKRKIRCELMTNFKQHEKTPEERAKCHMAKQTCDDKWSTEWQTVPNDATNMEIKADAKAPKIKLGMNCHIMVCDYFTGIWGDQFQIPSRWGTRSAERDIAVYVPYGLTGRDLHMITVRIARNESDDTVRLVSVFWHTSPAFIAKHSN
jgi:hypothetical protein